MGDWRFGITAKRWFIYSDIGPFSLDFGWRKNQGFFWSWNDSEGQKERS